MFSLDNLEEVWNYELRTDTNYASPIPQPDPLKNCSRNFQSNTIISLDPKTGAIKIEDKYL